VKGSGPSRTASAFERRAARAEALVAEATSSEILEFAAGLCRAQGAVAAAVEAAHGERALTGDLAQDLERFSGALDAVLRFAAERGPEPLSTGAREQRDQAPDALSARLVGWWRRGDASAREDYLARALVRPYAETLATLQVRPTRPLGSCPFCGGAPWIAARRTAIGADGAQRSLGCALCGGNWPVNRISCPACGEESPDQLPCFQSDKYPSVRLESCTTCHVYVKSLDLTLDARAIPEVDDLVSIAMDLWAAEQGFRRLEPGIAGV
jgi:FdhE protein